MSQRIGQENRPLVFPCLPLSSCCFVAEGIVGVAFGYRAAAVGEGDNITMSIMEIVVRSVCRFAIHQIDTAQIDGGQRIVRALAHHIAAIQQEVGVSLAHLLGNADTGSVVAIRRTGVALLQNDQLVEAVVLIQLRTVNRTLAQEIPICGCCSV